VPKSALHSARVSATGWLAWLLLCAAIIGSTANAEPLVARYLPGEHYQLIDAPVAYSGDRMPVIEFFLYSCPHCFALDAAVTRWQQSLPDDVSFRRVPVLYQAAGRFYARLFYTAKTLGVLERMHAKIFAAIHTQGKRLDNFQAARALFVANGVNGERFKVAFNSPAIDKQIAHAAQLMRAFAVRSVPSLGVAGRYWINGRMAGSNEAMFDVAEFLLQKTRLQDAK